VDNKLAVTLLEQKNLEDCVILTATIAIKSGVDAKKIPVKLLADMEKYFDINTQKEVSRDMLRTLSGEGKITDAEYKSAVISKETFAMKVSKI
jgi:hypothetical protein